MALFRIDGWDYYPANTSPATSNVQADGWFGNLAATATYAGRFGGGSIGFNGGAGQNFGEAIGKRYTTETTVVGQAIFFPANTTSSLTYAFYDAQGASGNQFFLSFEEFGVIRLYRGNNSGTSALGTIIATTPAKSFHDGEWNYIEIKSKISATSGLVEVRVNTVVVLSYAGATNNSLLTPILGLAPGWDCFFWSCNEQVRWDDRYILDNSGGSNTNYLGNVKVNTQMTIAAGDLTEMSVFGAASNWDAVNETVLTDVEYVYSGTMGTRDLYTMDPNVAAQNIFGVQVVGAHRQDDSTQLKSNLLLKTGGTLYAGQDNFLAQNYHYYRDMWELNPHTGVGWVSADLNAIQSGQKVLLA